MDGDPGCNNNKIYDPFRYFFGFSGLSVRTGKDVTILYYETDLQNK